MTAACAGYFFRGYFFIKTLFVFPSSRDYNSSIKYVSFIFKSALLPDFLELFDEPFYNQEGRILGKNKTNRKYKDRLFKRVFGEKKDLLELYNALNGSDYQDPEEIEINTIENFIYMGMRNDVSFLFTDVLNLYEHQSTVNPNLPLRGLFYFARLYQKMYEKEDIYSPTRLSIPFPQFIVFYNGTEPQPERKELKLSDSFVISKGRGDHLFMNYALECRAIQLNVNYGHNRELMEKCSRLSDYAALIAKVREKILKYPKDVDKAIDEAIEECIREGILADLLRTHREEAKMGLFTSWTKKDEEKFWQSEMKKATQRGLDQGKQEGMQQGIQQGQERVVSVIHRLRDGESPDALRRSGVDEETIRLALTCR